MSVAKMRPRQEYRQHSKSTLLRATEIMFRENQVLKLTEARKWKRRLAWAAGGAFLAGLAAGALLTRVVF
jgi:hypothetical protein